MQSVEGMVLAGIEQRPREDGILKLPFRLRRDLIVLLAVKLAMLSLLYVLFFSPSQRPTIDMAAHIAGPLPSTDHQ